MIHHLLRNVNIVLSADIDIEAAQLTSNLGNRYWNPDFA